MNSKLALITFLDDSGNRPDNTLPGGGPVDPGWGVRPPVDPGYGRPGFGTGYPDNALPGSGAHPWFPGHLGGPRPDQGLPGGGYPSGQPIPVPPPVTPDNSLPTTPSTPPPQISLPIYLPSGGTKPIEPDAAWELKYSVRFGWVLVPIEDAVAAPKK